MMIRSLVACVMTVFVTGGCGRGSGARNDAADSTAAVVLVIPVDSSATRTDSALLSAPIAGKKAPANAPHVGYDSAFGPSFTVDSTGKVTPIRKKKP